MCGWIISPTPWVSLVRKVKVQMPKVILVRRDPSVLMNVSDMERLFVEYGHLSSTEAKQRIVDVLNGWQVSVDVEDLAKAEALVRELRDIWIGQRLQLRHRDSSGKHKRNWNFSAPVVRLW